MSTHLKRCTPKLLDGLNYKSKGEDNGRRRSWGMFPSLQHFGGKGVCQSSEMGLRRLTSNSITHMDLHKPNNKLVNVQLEHLWCTNEPRVNTNSQDSPRLGLGGNQHLLLYSILCAWPLDQHPNVILSQNSQVGIPKFPKLGLSQLWRPVTLCIDLQLR